MPYVELAEKKGLVFFIKVIDQTFPPVYLLTLLVHKLPQSVN